jgi:anthranilate phosphoribosyltransferase
MVVHGDDGLDELTTTAGSATALWDGARVVPGRVDPAALGLARATPEALAGGDPARNAEIARAVLGGEPGPARDVVLLNAAAALFVASAATSIGEGLGVAAKSIDSGAARAKLAALAAASRAAQAAGAAS